MPKRSLDTAGEDIASMKQKKYSDETMTVIIKRDHDVNRYDANDAIAEVFKASKICTDN